MFSLKVAEDKKQKKFEQFKFHSKPCHVVKIVVVKFCGVSVSKVQDFFDTPDPYIEMKCPLAKKVKQFRTIVKSDITCGVFDEVFQFCIDSDQLDKPFPCRITLYDYDKLSRDDYIGRVKLNLTELPFGRQVEKNVNFKGHGKVVFKFLKTFRDSPDFRLGLELCDEERNFRLKRLPKVAEAIRKLIGDKNAPRVDYEAPVISVIGSGGGYRAVIGMTGAMEALNEAGITDTLTYMAGVSGSAWYMTTAYAHQNIGTNSQELLHSRLRESLSHNLKKDVFSLSFIKEYLKNYRDEKELYKQPISIVDFFGYGLGKRLLTSYNMGIKLSDMQDYIKDGDVPYLMFVAINVKDDKDISDFAVYMENSPFEIYIPNFGIGIPPSMFGSVWNRGFLARKCPEFPLHYYQGFCGNGFAVILKEYVEYNMEGGEGFDKYLDKIKKSDSPPEDEKTSLEKILHCLPKSCTNLIQNGLVEKTGRIFNFARYFDCPSFHLLNPNVSKLSQRKGKSKELNKPIKLSTTKNIISLADAGILMNVCTNNILRPQRHSDLLIIFDFNAYESDSSFEYMPLIQAAQTASAEGIKFPKIDFKKVVNSPPKEYQAFVGNGDDCPTVLWFTLCNTKFKKLKGYKPRHAENADDISSDPFNVFSVFDKGNKYSTFKFEYAGEDFDKLSDLMYFNVISNIENVKYHIEQATLLKRAKMNRMSFRFKK